MEEEEKPVNEDSVNPDALDAALGDDGYVELEEEEVFILSDDDDELDIAFPHDDPRDWY